MEVVMKSRLLLLYFSLLYVINVDAAVDVCVQLGQCSCQNSKGIIDLSPLALSGGEPKFKDQADSFGSYFYSWNPCNPFTESACAGVSGCQTDKGANFFTLGTPGSAKFIVDTQRGLILQYTATTDAKRTLDVILVCDETQEATLSVKGEDPPGSAVYTMTLKSKYACPKAGGGPGGSSSLSVGSVVVIIFFSLIIVYFVAGVAFQKFVRHASGKEMAPNHGLWTAVPGLVKDGVLFTVKCGRVGSSYDKI